MTRQQARDTNRLTEPGLLRVRRRIAGLRAIARIDLSPGSAALRDGYSMLAAGQIVEVKVQTVAVFGLFCLHQQQDVVVLIPETSWIASFCSCQQFAEPDDRITVKIIHVDARTGKVSASIKRLHPDPWEAGSLAPGTEHWARVVRFVEKADRCNDGAGCLLELMTGAFVMLCANGSFLQKDQRCAVTVRESNYSKRAVRVAVT